tara:strand:- start:14673 stop:15311 length:639 start_codon:yes stop_codon:yes gene_type:complete
MTTQDSKVTNQLNNRLTQSKFKQKELTEIYTFTESFSTDEVKSIVDYCSKLPTEDAEIGSNMEVVSVNDKLRSSIVRWVPMNEDTKFIYDRLLDMVIEANEELWDFDINSLFESVQYTEYYGSDNGHYDWHLDIGSGYDYRKISITVQLSDENDYSGGNLIIKIGPDGTETIIDREMGLSTIFPSYLLHRVNNIETGVRRSLVLWVSGPPLR